MKSKVEVDKAFVLGAPLPSHGDSYTVISHKFVIDTTKQMLANSGFVITHEKYRANGSGEVAQGIYHIKSVHDNDPDSELGMMFAWTNSYDKSIRFQCAIGAHVFACANGMVCGELNYARKHTGTADQEIKMQISSQIKNAQKAFDRIKDDRDGLRNTTLTMKQQAELLGRMYFNEDLISPRQMSCVKDEMEKPSFDYQADQENAWAFYNHVTHSYKSVHPRAWLSDSKNFHDFMVANVLNGMGITPTDTINTDDTVEEELVETTDPDFTISHNSLIGMGDLDETEDEEPSYVDDDGTEILAEVPATEEEVNHMMHGVDNNPEVVISETDPHGDEDHIDGVDELPEVDNTPTIVEDDIEMIEDDEDFDFEF